MDYQRIYDNIVIKAKTQNRVKGGEQYYEAHHILSVCLGGTGKASQWKWHPNIVLLTAREHFLVHWLLIRIYPQNRKLAHAFWAMCNLKGKSLDNRTVPSSRTYREAKEHRSSLGMSEEQKQKLRKPKKDSSKMGKYDKRGTKNPFFGKKHTKENIALFKEYAKNRPKPGNTKQVFCDGTIYESGNVAAKELGISRALLNYRIGSKKYNYYWVEKEV